MLERLTINVTSVENAKNPKTNTALALSSLKDLRMESGRISTAAGAMKNPKTAKEIGTKSERRP